MLNVSTIITDCDGVLTDGKYYYTEKGKAALTFHSNDSLAFILAKQKNIRIIIISSTNYHKINELRAKELDVEYYGVPVFKKLDSIISLGIDLSSCAYIGDCFDDIPVFKKVYLSFVPNSSLDEVKKESTFVLKRNGGEGCILEALKIIEKLEEIDESKST